jgi:hypothetical protein
MEGRLNSIEGRLTHVEEHLDIVDLQLVTSGIGVAVVRVRLYVNTN